MRNSQRNPITSRTPSKRTLYINQETPRRDMNTPFHSPYKDGKRNPNYINPSFISSHLFYPQDCQQHTPERVIIPSNQILTPNQLKKDQLYKQRLKTQATILQKSRERKKNKEKFGPGRNIYRANQPEYLLKSELSILQNYRQNVQLKQDRIEQISRKRYQQPEIPIFLQKTDKARKKSVSPLKMKKDENQDIVRELDELRRSGRGDQEGYRANLQKLIERNHRNLLQEDEQTRRQKYLLGSILKEQIRTKQTLKQRRWNY